MIINPQLRKEIEESIAECEACVDIEEANYLYNKLIAKYTTIDPNFALGLPARGKLVSFSGEKDSRPMILAIKVKLEMMLISAETPLGLRTQKMLNKINELIHEGETISVEELIPSYDNFFPDLISGPKFSKWVLEVEVISDKYLKTHSLYNKIMTICGNENTTPFILKQIIDCLRIIAEDEDFIAGIEAVEHFSKTDNKKTISKSSATSETVGKVFLVHGHDETIKQTVARMFERAGLEVIILHEQPDGGRTIIEKFERYSDVAYAVVLYTPCDMGRAQDESINNEKPRARQNVIFEHGFFIGQLGRDRVCALKKGDVETPGDIDGVIYISIDEAGAWKNKLGQNLKHAGLMFDFEKFVC